MTQQRRGRLGAAIIGGALALGAISATGGAGASMPTAAGGGGEPIAVAGHIPIIGLDPYGQFAADLGTRAAGTHLYDTLIASDGEGGYDAHLATEWEADEDGAWTFTLREATYSDGTEFTSADVASAVELMIAGEGPWAPLWASVTVETPDDRTAVFVQDDPNSALLANIALLPITPADQAAEEGFFSDPTVIGPYQVESFTSGQELVLVPNESYWGEAPAPAQLTLRTIPDISARVTALLNGEVDMIWGIPDDQFGQLQDEDGVVTESVAGFEQWTIWFNSSQPQVEDVRVRQAIWHAVDFEEIQAALFPYSATMSAGPVAQPVTDSASFEPYAYDPELAQSLLAEAGYEDGLTVRLQFSTALQGDAQPFADAIRSYLSAVGVTVEIEPKEQAVWLEDLLGLNWDINLQKVLSATGDVDYIIGRLYRCDAERTGFCSDELDAAIASAQQAIDPAERTEHYAEAQRIIWENAVGMFPMDSTATYAWADGLQGVDPDPDFAPYLGTITK